MTDDQSRIARVEERLEVIEQWLDKHEDMGVDVALLKQCLSTYNGSIKRIEGMVQETRDTVTRWTGGLSLSRWLIGGIGLMVIVQFVLSIVGRLS